MTPILILHGWGSCAKNWQRVKNGLERSGYTVYLPDLPGFGEGAALERAWVVDDYINWLDEYCEKNNLSRFFLIGHSFGGSLAVGLSLKYPEKVKKMFLISPALIREKTPKKAALKKTAKVFSFLPVSFKRIVYRHIIRSDYPAEPGPLRETYLKIIGHDLSDELPKVSVKSILFWGEKDKITPHRQGRLIKELISGAELKKLPGVYHNPHSENPELLVKTILENL